MKLLSKKALVRVKATGKYEQCEAYLVASRGGKTVVYLQDGKEVHKEKFSVSQFKDLDLSTLED